MSKPKGIQKGDRVRIVNPEIFVRCGYPLTMEMMEEPAFEKYSYIITEFLKKHGIVEADGFSVVSDSVVFHKILKALAYYECKSKGFGGNTRSIHTETMKELKDQVFEVTSVRFVKTGERCPGGSYCTMEGYDPPYLANEKTHRILKLGGIEIEAANVEQVKVE